MLSRLGTEPLKRSIVYISAPGAKDSMYSEVLSHKCLFVGMPYQTRKRIYLTQFCHDAKCDNGRNPMKENVK